MYVLRQKAVSISHPKRIDEHVTRLVPPPDFPQCIDQPEPANQKGRLRLAKIISRGISHNVEPAPKFKSDGLDGCNKPGVVGRYQAKLGKQEPAGIEIFAVKCGRKCLAPRAPRTFEHLFSDAFRNTAPMGGVLG